ncbi:MAG: sarcosine oxidase subunit beta [Dehalococcoidia bacterium]|nr:sarcosine oxidase subunit beta [Dehalococcoidia bacterium]
MLQLFRRERVLPRAHDLRHTYDVVIIGAGVHGLATAYYLGKEHGITNVAVLEKSYLGAGNSGRNTAILRANYRTPEGIPFFAASLELYEQLSQELGWNVLFSQCGHITLAHTDSAMAGLHLRAETNELYGVENRVLDREELGQLVPALDLSDRPRYEILAALYNPPGGIIRHDAVVWGYARACDRMGIEIHPLTEATEIRVSGTAGNGRANVAPIPGTSPVATGEASRGRVTGVLTNRGEIATRAVVNCTAGWATEVSRLAGVDLPIVTQPLQACVTEPLKPFLDKVIVSANLHVYVNQTDRGELVIGAEVDPYQSYSMSGTLPTLEQMASYTLELFPQLHNVKVLRQWAGICDMTPDYSPIIGGVEGLDGFYQDVGWGTYGFKAGPIAGKCLAELIATRKIPELIEPFALSRFRDARLVGEKAAAAVSH